MQQVISHLTAERDHYDRRVDRLALLAGRPEGLSDQQQEQWEFSAGARYGLDMALSALANTDEEKCACGKTLDANGEHDGGYGAWCG